MYDFLDRIPTLFSLLSFAYQHYGFGVDLKLINFINSHLLKNFKIDFTFLNTVSNYNMINRLKLRRSLNRYDRFSQNFYKNVQIGFLKIANKNKRKYKIINSNLDIKNNQDQIIQTIKKLIKKKHIDFNFHTYKRHEGSKAHAEQYLKWETDLVDKLDKQELSFFNIF